MDDLRAEAIMLCTMDGRPYHEALLAVAAIQRMSWNELEVLINE